MGVLLLTPRVRSLSSRELRCELPALFIAPALLDGRGGRAPPGLSRSRRLEVPSFSVLGVEVDERVFSRSAAVLCRLVAGLTVVARFELGWSSKLVNGGLGGAVVAVFPLCGGGGGGFRVGGGPGSLAGLVV